jgi:hypothetical protein
MAECELSNDCESFYEKLSYMQSTARLMKGAYCKWNHSECARYMVYKMHGKDKVPIDLYPSDLDGAKKLVNLVVC